MAAQVEAAEEARERNAELAEENRRLRAALHEAEERATGAPAVGAWDGGGGDNGRRRRWAGEPRDTRPACVGHAAYARDEADSQRRRWCAGAARPLSASSYSACSSSYATSTGRFAGCCDRPPSQWPPSQPVGAGTLARQGRHGLGATSPAAASAEEAHLVSVSVMVPPMRMAGEVIQVEMEGQTFDVTIPRGVRSGQSFEAELPPPPPPEPRPSRCHRQRRSLHEAQTARRAL